MKEPGVNVALMTEDDKLLEFASVPAVFVTRNIVTIGHHNSATENHTWKAITIVKESV